MSKLNLSVRFPDSLERHVWSNSLFVWRSLVLLKRRLEEVLLGRTRCSIGELLTDLSGANHVESHLLVHFLSGTERDVSSARLGRLRAFLLVLGL